MSVLTVYSHIRIVSVITLYSCMKFVCAHSLSLHTMSLPTRSMFSHVYSHWNLPSLWLFIWGGGEGEEEEMLGKICRKHFDAKSIFHGTVFCIMSPTECCCTVYLRIYQPRCENVEAINQCSGV